jgi:hypothetical protein
LTVDLGTGDGAAVLEAARRSPEEAFVGLDADASRMREASSRAARAARKGGLPNAWFAVAAAEALPRELDGRVDVLTVILPWGSLLRGAVGPEPWFTKATQDMLRRGGELRVLLSVAPRDGMPIAQLDARSVAELVHGYETTGWSVTEARRARAADISTIGSSWARRLGIPVRREAWLLHARLTQARSSAA